MLQSKKALLGTIVLAAASVSTGAYAELPAAATAAMDTVGGFADTVIGWMWTIGTGVLVGVIGLKLVKKAANKAT